MRKVPRKRTVKKKEAVLLGHYKSTGEAFYRPREKLVAETFDQSMLWTLMFKGNYYNIEKNPAFLEPYHKRTGLDISRGVIRLDESASYGKANLFNPAEESDEIFLELANLNENSEQEILAFVNRYGLLKREPESETAYVKLKDAPVFPTPKSEPVSHIQAYIRQVRDILALSGAIKEKAFDKVTDLVYGIETYCRTYNQIEVFSNQMLEALAKASGESLFILGQTYQSHLIHKLMLGKVGLFPLPDYESGDSSESLFATDLLSVIYLQTHWLIVGKRRLILCPGCEEYFIPKTKQPTRFCSKKCKNKINMREYRKPKKGRD